MFTPQQFVDLLYRELNRLLDFRAEFGWRPEDRDRFNRIESALFRQLESLYCN